ncbi:MAG: L-lactate permease, partial [Anaerolineaceae bacterium]|nr:L-lactate permease [Anaerolineaceae bacterium]
ILAMVAMATVMQNAGMTRTLAEWLSRAVAPDWYALVGALIGALGSFMTGSNTNSNAVFAGLQLDSAQLLGLGVPLVLALQTSAGAIASMMAPAKILVGASTVGIGQGDEGRVLRSLLLYGSLILVLLAAVTWLLLRAGY